MYQRKVTAPPRLAREGWVTAGNGKRTNKRAMLIPKTGDPTEHIPRLYDFSEVICPPERQALREIVETAEVVRQNGHVYLTARVSAATLDSLATFETSREDLEDGSDHELEPDEELVNEDGTNDSSADREEMLPARIEARRGYLAERQERHRATYDRTKEGGELRKVNRQVNALAAKKRKRVQIEDRKGATS